MSMNKSPMMLCVRFIGGTTESSANHPDIAEAGASAGNGPPNSLFTNKVFVKSTDAIQVAVNGLWLEPFVYEQVYVFQDLFIGHLLDRHV